LLDLTAIKDAAVEAIEDVKGFDITVLDVAKLTSMTNYMIICSAKSSRQTRAIADNVHVKLKALGVEPRGQEGEGTGDWVLVDLDDVIVHVMTPTTRTYYNLEQLWSEDSKHITPDAHDAPSA